MTTCFMFMNKKFMLINFLFRNSESPASKMRLVKKGDFLLFWGLRYGPYVPYASPASASRFAPYASALNFVLRYGPYVPYASPASASRFAPYASALNFRASLWSLRPIRFAGRLRRSEDALVNVDAERRTVWRRRKRLGGTRAGEDPEWCLAADEDGPDGHEHIRDAGLTKKSRETCRAPVMRRHLRNGVGWNK